MIGLHIIHGIYFWYLSTSATRECDESTSYRFSRQSGPCDLRELMRTHDVVGIDKIPCSTADYIGDIRDSEMVKQALAGVDVIVHAAALHAPHVG